MRISITPWSAPLSILVLVAVLGCTGAPSSSRPVTSEAERPAPTGAPKVISLGFQQEPAGFNTQLLQGTGGIGGVDMVPPIAQNYLMVLNPVTFTYVPQLAAEPLSVERGTWRVNPDGSMDTTWKLKPNIKWHDGAPFTSEDLLFSLTVYQDPEIPNSNRDIATRMTSASAPDPQTFVIHWASVYVQADRAPGLTPMPRHLLKDLYETDKSNFVNSPVFTSGFVGLGPFRLAHWEGGTSMDFVRFDDYYLGRPPLDRVNVRFLADPATTIANVLAGAVDVVTSVGDLESSLQVKQRWEGTGNQVIVSVSGNLNHLEIQHRPEYAKLQHGLVERNTRAALYHAIDRATMTEVTTSGLAPVADSWITPNDPLRSQLESAIPQFPYDPRRARELLAQGGFVAGPDGVLVHQPDGERLEVMDYAGPAQARDQTVIADGWKAVGVDVNLYTIPPALDRERQTRSTLPGAGISQAPGEQFSTYKLHTSAITTPANGWSGLNRSGYVNPRVDAILDKMVTTIDLTQRIALHRELLQEQMGDLAIMPLNWPVRAALVLKGVQGVQGGTTWNINEWNKTG